MHPKVTVSVTRSVLGSDFIKRPWDRVDELPDENEKMSGHLKALDGATRVRHALVVLTKNSWLVVSRAATLGSADVATPTKRLFSDVKKNV